MSDPTDIVKCWKNHFNDIYTPSIASNDVDFSEVVNSTVKNACAPCSQVLDASVLISAKDVIYICSKLKCNTAYGCDKLYVENLKYGGPSLIYLISRLFTSMHYHTYRPKQLKKGVIVPILKSGKDPSEPTNNRGITLMSVISKVYDSIFFKRHEKWFKRVLCETQGVAQKNCSSLNTALILQEAVYANTCVYVVLLDVKKVFDSVWINGMLYKLIKLGVDIKDLWEL